MSDRRVLIVAVSEYAETRLNLPGVERDADCLRETLSAHSEVKEFYSLVNGQAKKSAILEELKKIAGDAKATDQVVIYLGGHGTRETDKKTGQRKYYFLPHEATFAPENPDRLPLDEVGGLLSGMKAKELVVILDFCFSGGGTVFSWSKENLDEVANGWRSAFLMAAARGRELAGEDDAGGFFLQAFCKTLAGEGVTPDAQGRISALLAFERAAGATEEVAKSRGHKQTPVFSGSGSLIYLTQPSSPQRRGKPHSLVLAEPPPKVAVHQPSPDYFCYVSRQKVDQLHSQIADDEQVDRFQLKDGTPAEAGLSAVSVYKLFENASYGMRGLVQRERKVKTQYLKKLRRVIGHIAEEHAIPSLESLLAADKGEHAFFHYRGEFRPATPLAGRVSSETLVTLKSQAGGRTLLLDCSLRNFSEGNEPDGSFHIHSGNQRFFSGQIGLWLETVAVYFDATADEIFGSPLFLKLCLRPARANEPSIGHMPAL